MAYFFRYVVIPRKQASSVRCERNRGMMADWQREFRPPLVRRRRSDASTGGGGCGHNKAASTLCRWHGTSITPRPHVTLRPLLLYRARFTMTSDMT